MFFDSPRRIWLVQTGVITRPLVNARLSEAVRLNYMGAAEFEFGAQPKSLREMQALGTDGLKKFRFDNIKLTNGRSLRALGPLAGAEIEHYEEQLLRIISGEGRCKEKTYLSEWLNPELLGQRVANPAQYIAEVCDFWWDIQNNVMMSFDKPFMQRLPKILQHSWDYMDANPGRRSH